MASLLVLDVGTLSLRGAQVSLDGHVEPLAVDPLTRTFSPQAIPLVFGRTSADITSSVQGNALLQAILADEGRGIDLLPLGDEAREAALAPCLALAVRQIQSGSPAQEPCPVALLLPARGQPFLASLLRACDVAGAKVVELVTSREAIEASVADEPDGLYLHVDWGASGYSMHAIKVHQGRGSVVSAESGVAGGVSLRQALEEELTGFYSGHAEGFSPTLLDAPTQMRWSLTAEALLRTQAGGRGPVARLRCCSPRYDLDGPPGLYRLTRAILDTLVSPLVSTVVQGCKRFLQRAGQGAPRKLLLSGGMMTTSVVEQLAAGLSTGEPAALQLLELTVAAANAVRRRRQSGREARVTPVLAPPLRGDGIGVLAWNPSTLSNEVVFLHPTDAPGSGERRPLFLTFDEARPNIELYAGRSTDPAACRLMASVCLDDPMGSLRGDEIMLESQRESQGLLLSLRGRLGTAWRLVRF